MTERENALTAINCGVPEWVPDAAKVFKMCRAPISANGPFGGGYDEFGVLWSGKTFHLTPDPRFIRLKEIEDWREVYTPIHISDEAWEKCAGESDLDGGRSGQLVLYSVGTCYFERLLSFMGFEGALMAMLEEQEAVDELFSAIDEHLLGNLEKIKKYYNPDVVMMNDDTASANGLLYSPKIYRELVKPHHKKFIQRVRELDMLACQHSCGKCADIVGEFIDNGANIWNNAQSVNNVPELKKKYAGQICFMGGMDYQGPATWLDATEEMLRAEIRRCMDDCAPGGGYIIEAKLLDLDDDSPEFRYKEWIMLDEAEKYGRDFYKK